MRFSLTKEGGFHNSKVEEKCDCSLLVVLEYCPSPFVFWPEAPELLEKRKNNSNTIAILLLWEQIKKQY